MCGSSSKTTTSNQTTTPTVAPWLSAAQQGNDFLGTWADANWGDFAPEAASSEQNTALAGVNALPSAGSGALGDAVSSATSLTGQTAPTYTAAQSSAPMTPTASTYGATNAGSTGYTAAQAAAPAMAATSTYAPTGYGASTYNPSTTAGAGSVNGANISTADIQRLMSPYTSDVVNSTLNNMDLQSGQQQAALKAQAGLSGGFGGSGYGISAAELGAEQGMNRAQEQASLLNTGYDTALTGAQSDAANRQTAALANQATREETDLANITALNSAGAFNAGQTQSAAAANAAAANTAGATNAAAQNQNSQFIENVLSSLNLSNAASQNTASEFGANASNTASLANAGAANTAASQNAAAQNAMSELGYSGQLQNGQFNAGQENTASANDQQAQLQSHAQQLQAALGLGALGSQQFSDANTAVGTQAALGQTQYGQDLARQYTPLTVAQLVSNILSGTPTGAYTTINQSGTDTTTSNPSFLDDLLNIGNTGSKVAAAI